MSDEMKEALKNAENFIHAKGSSKLCDGEAAVRVVRDLIRAFNSKAREIHRQSDRDAAIKGIGDLLVCIMHDHERSMLAQEKAAKNLEKIANILTRKERNATGIYLEDEDENV